jgi:hypothetical protein
MADRLDQHTEDPSLEPDRRREEDRIQRELEDRLQIFGTKLMRTAYDRVSNRAELESRWLNDLRQYNSRYDADTEARIREDNTRSQVFVNLTRPKVNTAESRITDMLFPNDERNWAIEPTPSPELARAIKEASGRQVQDDDPVQAQAREAAAIVKEAKRRAEAMQKEIDDQLEESDYYIACRDAIHDGLVLGTGVVKGPVVVGRMRNRWNPITDPGSGRTLHVLERVPETRPAVYRVDPWDFYPDPAVAELKDSESELERHWMSRKELVQMINDPGVLPGQVALLLQEDPKSFRTTNSWLQEMRRISGVTNITQEDNRYEVWEYTGPIEKEDLLACGCEFVEDEDNPLELYEGTVLFGGNRIVKAIINPMDTAERGYSVWNWERDDTSIFGFGLPYQLRHAQRVLNAAWRLVMENSALSSGPQMVVHRTKIEPADGDWRLRARKLWYTTSESVQLDHIFRLIDIPNRQQDLMQIVDRVQQFFDDETSLTTLQSGQQGAETTKTASGISMLMNAANTTLRRAIKYWDDDITVPIIQRFYDWNMQYSENESVMGDFEVKARGSSSLVLRDLMAQNLTLLMQHAAANPFFAERTKWTEAYRKTVQSYHLPADEVVKTDEELEEERRAAAENPPQDPEQMKLEAQMQIEQAKLEDAQAARQHEEALRAMEKDIKMMDLAIKRDVGLEQIAAKLQEARMREQNKRDLYVDERDLKVATGAGI